MFIKNSFYSSAKPLTSAPTNSQPRTLLLIIVLYVPVYPSERGRSVFTWDLPIRTETTGNQLYLSTKTTDVRGLPYISRCRFLVLSLLSSVYRSWRTIGSLGYLFFGWRHICRQVLRTSSCAISCTLRICACG